MLSLLSATLFGLADFSCGFATRRNTSVPVVFLSQIAGALLLIAVAPWIGAGKPSPGDFIWGALAGLTGVGGLALLYRGIALGVVAIVAPLSALSAAMLPVIFGSILGERPSTLAIIGGLLCLPAIVLLSIEPKTSHAKGQIRVSLLLGIFAGCLLGGFYIFISRTNPASGLWPLLGARSAAIIAVAIFALLSRQNALPVRGTRLPAIAGGLFDMAANIAFLLASRMGLLMVVSVLTSLYPAPTVILARVVFKQRLGFARISGLVVALAGVALIALR